MRLASVLLLAACVGTVQSCSSLYHSIMGTEKRELLVARVDDARESQAEAQAQFQSTFEAFQAVTNYDGGDLEKLYKKLSSEYDDAESAANSVSKRIGSVKDVAGGLFKEWEKEIGEYENQDLQRRSEETLRATRDRYESLIGSMEAAEASMQPVLRAFNDQVLFLKHNLNAQAIADLKQTTLEIEQDVGDLIATMEASISEAEQFLDELQPAGA